MWTADVCGRSLSAYLYVPSIYSYLRVDLREEVIRAQVPYRSRHNKVQQCDQEEVAKVEYFAA